jgi:hypothetical protein
MINLIATAFMAVLAANLFITSMMNAPQVPEIRTMTPPISVGKERSFSSGRDASMFTQQVRRQAIVNAHYGSPNLILRESNHTTGFTNGVVEIYSLSNVCQRICAAVVEAVCNPVLDAGTVNSEFCEVLDGGDGTTNAMTTLDAGTSQTVVC